MNTDWRRPLSGVKMSRPEPESKLDVDETPADGFLELVDPVDTIDNDDLAAELAKRAPRGAPGRTTLVLAGAVLVVAGFLGGVLVQRNYGAAPASGGGLGNLANAAAARQNAGGFGGGNGGTGGTGGTGGGQAGAGRNATTGTVKLVDGTTVYLTTSDGETVTVKTSTSTTVRTEQAAALADLPVGATVSVQGTTGSDGVVTATQVTVQK